MIDKLIKVSENCRKGTTTVWDAEQVDKVIRILMQRGSKNDRYIKN